MDKSEQLNIKDFDVIKELGCGSYGRVQLVRKKSDQKYYALKSMFLANAKQKEKDAALN
jgi:serine/threonine protein kinase